jgi:SAM-dependent methyltransferase
VTFDIARSLDPAREEAELRAYLGDDFRLERLQHYQEHLDAEFADIGHEDTFYLTSRAYLYNLTAFAMTGTKVPYLQELVAQVPPGARLLDYGCGIGADGLLLLEAGYRVEFADFDNPSVEYLRWRLKRRGLEAPIHDLNQGVPGGFDAAYSFDVIEHVADPFAFLGELEQRAQLVVVNFLAPVPGDQELHHDLPIRELLAHVADRGLRRYALLHDRSHLVLYEPRRASLPARLLHRARMRSR